MCIKSEFKEICLKLATNGQSDKGFLLTSKVCPQGVFCPCPGAIYMYKIIKNVYKIRFRRDSFETCNILAKRKGLSDVIKIFFPKGSSAPALGLYTCIKALKYTPGSGVRWAFTEPLVLWFKFSDQHLEIRKIAVCIWNSQNCSMFRLAFLAGSLQGHWWGFISRNYLVWPIFLMNVFIALKGTHFLFLFFVHSVNLIKSDKENIRHDPLTYHFSSSCLPQIQNLQKSYFCNWNFLHSVEPFWRLVLVMTLITLRNTGTQVALHQKLSCCEIQGKVLFFKILQKNLDF